MAKCVCAARERKSLTVTTGGFANDQFHTQGLTHQEQKIKGQRPAQGRFRGRAEHALHALMEGVTFQLKDSLSPTSQPCHDNMPDAEVSSTMPPSASSLRTSLNYVSL